MPQGDLVFDRRDARLRAAQTRLSVGYLFLSEKAEDSRTIRVVHKDAWCRHAWKEYVTQVSVVEMDDGRCWVRRNSGNIQIARWCEKCVDYRPQNFEWREQAACIGAPPEWWFPPKGAVSFSKQARAICHGCPVQADCLNHALEAPEPFGMWGGLTPQEREKLRNRPQIAARSGRR